MTAARGRIIVIGGSIAGLFAAILLRRLGWRVDIYERSGEALASRGAGITTHDELYAAFRQAGVTIDRELAIESSGRSVLDHSGAILDSLEMPQLMTSWGLLYRFLRERIPDAHYHNAKNLTGLRQDLTTVSVAFADGTSAHAEYLIGADGMRSSVRELAMPEAAIKYAGYTAWRGLAAEADLTETVRVQVAGRFLVCLPPGEHVLGYMVAGPGDTVEVGQRWYNWVWYRPAPEATRLRELLTGTDGIFYPLGIPHHLIEPRFADDLQRDAQALIAPQLRAAISVTKRPFLQPIHELASKRLVNGRVIVIGDAAFTARPHIGLGVSKAADDAAQLAQVFVNDQASEFNAALAAWETARLSFGRAAVAHSAALGCYLDGREPVEQAEIDRHAFFRRPDVVLARIAARNPYQFLEL